jgi:hypothetical protein
MAKRSTPPRPEKRPQPSAKDNEAWVAQVQKNAALRIRAQDDELLREGQFGEWFS